MICVLITAVMLIGATIFTYAQISRINTEYIDMIFRALQESVTKLDEMKALTVFPCQCNVKNVTGSVPICSSI